MNMMLLIIRVVLVAVFLLEGWALFHILRQQGKLLLRLELLEAQQPEQRLAPSVVHAQHAVNGQADIHPNALPPSPSEPSLSLPGGERSGTGAIRAERG